MHIFGKALQVSIVLVSAISLVHSQDKIATNVEEALSAYRRSHITEAKAGFSVIAVKSTASPRDRAIARRELARIAWLIDADAAAAQSQLRSPQAWADKPCETASLLARILREAGKPTRAARTAAQHRAECSNDRDPLLVEQARAWADLAIKHTGHSRSQALLAMRRALASLTEEGQRSLGASRLTLELGLLSDSPEMAFLGWRSFFWLSKTEVPPALVQDFPKGEQVFRQGLAANSLVKNEVELLRMLVRAGFEREAEGFARVRGIATQARSQEPRAWSSIMAYFQFHDAVERATVAHYRSLAHGKDESAEYKTEITTLIDKSAASLTSLDIHAQASAVSPHEILRKEWGLYWTLGLTGGYLSLHIGHIIEDAHETIVQHGRTGEVERIVLENMLSNGYESWLWDGWAEAGGWSEAGTRIIQVRTSYVGSILKALALRPGHPARARAEGELPELEKRDFEVLESKTLADLPGLAQRLRLQTVDQILADMKAAGQAVDASNAFLERYWRALVQATITIHEGRHLLDQKQYSGKDALASDELEFRAKLSELQLGEYPRLSLAAIVAGQIGGESSHGKSNTRILIELGKWIVAHPEAMVGFTPGEPPLAQVDKLTDQQLRDFACSLDPACKGHLD